MLPKNIFMRETQQMRTDVFRRLNHVSGDFLQRLGLWAELSGHQGCVNCLQWNSSGSLLISGSDDYNVHIWDPHRKKLLQKISSGHSGNIFSVKYMPFSNDTVIASAAADSRINILEVSTGKMDRSFTEHCSRVKRLEVCQTDPHLLWSAAEDGIILQIDLRCSTNQSNVLVDLNGSVGKHAEAKCLCINPFRNELLAVGANDPFVRLFDRRMIKPRELPQRDNGVQDSFLRQRAMADLGYIDIEQEFPDFTPQYFVPGHLKHKEALKRRFRSYAVTFVTFSPDNGSELLVNLGGEQIYIFNLDANQQPMTAIEFDMKHQEFSANPTLAPEVAAIKQKANMEFEQKQYSQAIKLYNEGLLRSHHPVLYCNRAAAKIKRNWHGDMYSAYRDCQLAKCQDPSYIKAHLRSIKCLIEMVHLEEANDEIESFKRMFPEHKDETPFSSLIEDLKEKCAKKKRSSDTIARSTTNRRYGYENEEDVFNDENDMENVGNENTIDYQRLEQRCRKESFDFTHMFSGHCNTTTDIKEANFFGNNCEYIAAGSDDGKFFVWEKSSGNIVKIFKGDDSIVNCLQCHPSICLLASSGIDPVVRLWSPLSENASDNDRLVTKIEQVTQENQRRMNEDPFETLLMNIGYNVGQRRMGDDGEDEEDGDEGEAIQCRPS